MTALHATALLTEYFTAYTALASELRPLDPVPYAHFKIGPFQFLVSANELGDTVSASRTVRVAALELIPQRYRARLPAAASLTGPDTLLLKGGRVAIVGCLQCGEHMVLEARIKTRGMRSDAPWILGSVDDPPSFVLDTDALLLHFYRRV